MKGLLLKDWYLLRKAFVLYAVCCVAFQAAPVGGMPLTVLYATLLPSAAFAYDDRSRWGELAAMMPYSLRDIVLSRYIMGWFGILAFHLLGLAGQGLFSAVLPDYRERQVFYGLPGFLTAVSLSALLLALMLPLYFRFDAEKSRVLRLVVIALAAGAVSAILVIAGVSQMDIEGAMPEGTAQEGTMLKQALYMLSAAGMVTAVSIPLSMLAYRARRK